MGRRQDEGPFRTVREAQSWGGQEHLFSRQKWQINILRNTVKSLKGENGKGANLLKGGKVVGHATAEDEDTMA